MVTTGKSGAVLMFVAVAACAVFGGEAPETGTPAPLAVMGRSEADYCSGLAFLFQRLRGETQDDGRCAALYSEGKALWLKARFGGDSASEARSGPQSAWPRDAKAAPPTIGLASWVLALNEQGFGVLGARRLSWAMVQQAHQRRAIVFLETENGYRWVQTKQHKAKNLGLVLSDGAVISCGNEPRRDMCTAKDGRQQWLIIFPRNWQACAFLKNTREHAKATGSIVFWYPRFLEDYLVTVNGGATEDPLPSVPRKIPCD